MKKIDLFFNLLLGILPLLLIAVLSPKRFRIIIDILIRQLKTQLEIDKVKLKRLKHMT
jgi:hypothetical protein